MICAIVAADLNNAIGINGGMLCHIPGDLHYFKETTMGATVIVGRKTYDGLPVKPLPGREHIIITRDAGDTLTEVAPKVCKTTLQGAKSYLQSHSDDYIFIIGGGEIYAALLEWCERVYLTRIEHAFPCADTYFPVLDPDEWVMVGKSEPKCENSYTYQFLIYDKVMTTPKRGGMNSGL